MDQPGRGLVATAIVIAISLAYIALWDFGTFNSWVAFFALSFIPFEVVTGVIWGGDPPFVRRLTQPAKGVALLGVTLFVGLVVSQFIYRTLGASQGSPGPMPPSSRSASSSRRSSGRLRSVVGRLRQ